MAKGTGWKDTALKLLLSLTTDYTEIEDFLFPNLLGIGFINVAGLSIYLQIRNFLEFRFLEGELLISLFCLDLSFLLL